ncbi:site-specific integrase [Staphylococcus equorum]|uniref:Site-specific integrase n=1 Tax=Staphylococcus equorum TaxID=246432 RepID=A0A9X4LAA3_9STAP|nr:site-specific integrase [Staphylococcus equorum]ALM56686.1 integrase [Staphylococcus equorum]MDG0819938.1 site-specific integrase [Staphylococcus equorum]MDG0840789.1 site-specific integrase [Staphylococcus equorum]MDG0846262.1 site-specific integrase [Staphylococcus equorum]
MQTRCYDGKKWQYEFKHNGKRYRKKGFRTKREADSAGLDKLNELKKGVEYEPNLSFYDYFKTWCETFKQPTISEKTYKSYAAGIEHIKQHSIGNKKLKDVTRYHYQEFINEFAKEHSKETIRKLNGYIRTSLDDAVYEGLLAKNPTFKVKYRANNPNKSEDSKYINLQDYEVLKKTLKSKSNASSLVLFIMICTGCRVSGVLNLKKDYINKVKNEIYIDEHKTDSSLRYVSISKQDTQFILKSIDNLPRTIDGTMFGTLTINAVNKRLKAYCNDLGIKEITSHALRHTHCSYLLAKGVSIYYISKRLGHKNISVTTDVYSHLLEETYREENQKAIDIISAM